MPYRAALEDALLRVTLHGALTPDDLRNMAAEVVAIEQARDPVPDRLFDFTGITEFSRILHHEVVDMARLRRDSTLKNPIRSALVVNSPVAFGYARVFQTLMDNPNVTVRIFQDLAEAEAWLAGPA